MAPAAEQIRSWLSEAGGLQCKSPPDGLRIQVVCRINAREEDTWVN